MDDGKKQGMVNKIYLDLREMVANHRFQPGTRINVEKLARELGVSRTPVWEAVRRLEQEGLLKNIPNRGVFMIEMTLEKALDLFQVRLALDALAGALAAGNMNQSTLKKMAECLREQLQVVERGDLVRYSQLDYEFHYLIYARCENSFLLEILDSIKLKMQPVNIRITPVLMKLYQDHLEIFRGLRAGDSARVERAFRGHNERVLEQIKEEIAITGQMRKESKRLQRSQLRVSARGNGARSNGRKIPLRRGADVIHE
jgi:DNA-binding GntR family transcriptional regulator